MPKVSVVIPFYNNSRWLKDAIQSVLSQTFDDFEIILVDDGSTEAIFDYIDTNDWRINYYRQENHGPAAARNFGIDKSRGRYVAFLDSDDLFYPCKLEKQLEIMDNEPNALLSHTSYEQISPEGKFLNLINSGLFSGYVYPEIALNCPIATPTVVIRRDKLSQDMRFEERVRVGEDIIFWARIAKRSRILGINKPLSMVRMHGYNAALDTGMQITGMQNVLQYLIKTDEDLNARQRRKLKSVIYYNIGRLYLKEGSLYGMTFFFRSLAKWPFNLQLFRFIYGTIVHRMAQINNRYFDIRNRD